jgi:hypothetical protein
MTAFTPADFEFVAATLAAGAIARPGTNPAPVPGDAMLAHVRAAAGCPAAVLERDPRNCMFLDPSNYRQKLRAFDLGAHARLVLAKLGAGWSIAQ